MLTVRRGARALGTAGWLTLVAVSRNRLALCMVVFFLPLWIAVVRWAALDVTVFFRLHAVSGDLVASSSHVSQITGALNAVTLITGFIMLKVTFATRELDQRLILAGFPRTALQMAKMAILLLAAAVVAAYAAWLMQLSWPVQHPALMAGAVFMAALEYGGLGIMLGSVLPELEGILVVLMMSLVDLGLQNPTMTRRVSVVPMLPLYGPMQTALAAGFTDTLPLRELGHGLLWLTATTTVGLGCVYARTRCYPRQLPHSADVAAQLPMPHLPHQPPADDRASAG